MRPAPPDSAPPPGETGARVALAYVTCSVIWGTTFYAIRACIGPGGYPTYQAAALRFVLAALVVVGLAAAGRASPGPRSRAQAAWLTAAGLLNFAGYALTYRAEESIPGGLACVIYGTQPLLTAALAAATGTERAPRSAVIGSLASLGGVALIFYDRLEVSAQQATGVALMMAAVGCGTCMNVILKRHAGGLHPLAQNAWFLSIVGAAMTLLALAEGRPVPWPPPPGPTVALVYLALLGSVVAFAAYFYLLRHASLMTATTIMLVQPVIALLVDAVWEAQPINGLAYVGAAVTTSGVGVSLVLGRRALKAASPAAPPKGASSNETVV